MISSRNSSRKTGTRGVGEKGGGHMGGDPTRPDKMQVFWTFKCCR